MCSVHVVMAAGCVLSSSSKSNKCLALLLLFSFLFDTQKCSIHWEGRQRLLTDESAILPQNSWDIYGPEAGQLRERVWAEVNPTRLRDFRTLLTTQAPNSSAE